MRQLLFLVVLLLLHTNVAFALEEKCKTDVYFANGILTIREIDGVRSLLFTNKI